MPSTRTAVDPSAATGLRLAAAAALVAYAVFLFAPQVLNDGDTYWHITAGEWILDHLAVPAIDPFSASVAGRPWVVHEWLAEVLMALAFRLGGWNGIVILYGGVAAFTIVLLARRLTDKVPQMPAALLLILGGACVVPSALARPHMLSLPVLVLWTDGLLAARRRGTSPEWPLLLLMPVWANLHGSFIFGLALLAPFWLEAVGEAGAAWRRTAAGWTLFAAAALAAALLTPQGWRGVLFPFQLMQLASLSAIGEWHATNFQHFQPIEAALIAFLYYALTRGVRLAPLRLLLLLGLLHLALQHTRHQMLAGPIGALVLADPRTGAFLSGLVPPGPARHSPLARAGRTWIGRHAVAAAALVLGVSFTVLRLAMPLVRTDGPESPVGALAAVPAAVARMPVFNDYTFGGYLIFHGVRPFVDGRADLYGDAFLDAFDAALHDSRAFAALADRYGIRWTMLETGSPQAAMVEALPGWRRLYADGVAVVDVRTDGLPP